MRLVWRVKTSNHHDRWGIVLPMGKQVLTTRTSALEEPACLLSPVVVECREDRHLKPAYGLRKCRGFQYVSGAKLSLRCHSAVDEASSGYQTKPLPSKLKKLILKIKITIWQFWYTLRLKPIPPFINCSSCNSHQMNSRIRYYLIAKWRSRKSG